MNTESAGVPGIGSAAVTEPQKCALDFHSLQNNLLAETSLLLDAESSPGQLAPWRTGSASGKAAGCRQGLHFCCHTALTVLMWGFVYRHFRFCTHGYDCITVIIQRVSFLIFSHFLPHIKDTMYRWRASSSELFLIYCPLRTRLQAHNVVLRQKGLKETSSAFENSYTLVTFLNWLQVITTYWGKTEN